MSNIPGDQTNVVFKLHLDKKSAEIKQAIKSDDLERRIKNLEKLLGTTSVGKKFIILCADTVNEKFSGSR